MAASVSPTAPTETIRTSRPRGGDSGVPLTRITMPVVAVLAVAGAVAGGSFAVAKIAGSAEAANVVSTRNETRVDAHDKRLNALEAEKVRADERWDRIQADLADIKCSQEKATQRIERTLTEITEHIGGD